MSITTMRLFVCASVLLYIGTACKKTGLPSFTPQPVEIRSELIYPDQGLLKPWSAPVRFDLDKDGRFEIVFYTQLVGDPLHQEDKMQFRMGTNLSTALAVNAQEETPQWNRGDTIPVNSPIGSYQWYVASDLVLVQEVTPMLPNSVYWMGRWQQPETRYIGFQWMNDDGICVGWIAVRTNKSLRQVEVVQAGVFQAGETQTRAGY